MFNIEDPTPNLPQGPFSIIYMDPPWPTKGGDVDARYGTKSVNVEKHYQMMTLDQLRRLPVTNIAAKDSMLFMWVVNNSLKEAIQLGESWGFEYNTVFFVWHKQQINPTVYVNASIEQCLLFRRGKVPGGIENISFHPDQFHSECRTVHSRKPDHFRRCIAGMFPNESKIELFARESNNGWTTHGDQKELLDLTNQSLLEY